MPRALRTVVLVTVLWAVMASTAAANVVRVPIATPAAGQVDVTTFDLSAGAKAPKRVKITATLPAVQKRQLKVLVATQKTKTALHVMVVVVRPGKASTTATAARGGGVYVNVDGRTVRIRRSHLRRIRNVLNELPPGTDLCDDASALSQLILAIGVGKPAGRALLDTILRVACGRGDDTDRKALEALNLTLPAPAQTTPPTDTPPASTTTPPANTPPAPVYTFGCRAYTGQPPNANEGICTLRTDQQVGAFNRVKLTANNGTAISQCYNGPPPNSCTVDSPGQPNNFVIFSFPSPLTDSGDMNLRSLSTPWPFPVISSFSTDGGQTFTNAPPYTP